MKVKLILSLSALVFLAFDNKTNTIEWNAARKLTWNDFKASSADVDSFLYSALSSVSVDYRGYMGKTVLRSKGKGSILY